MDLTDDVEDLFRELINVGVGRAAHSLNQLIGMEVRLSVPVIRAFRLDGIKAYLRERSIREVVSVCQAFNGRLNGKGIVSFPVVGGRTLVNLLLDEEAEDVTAAGTEDGGTEWFNVIELEAIAEVGNIIINAVQGSISDMARMMVNYSLPMVRVVEELADLFLNDADKVYIMCEALFTVKETEIKGMVVLIYACDNIDFLIETLLKDKQEP